ncbi:MAG: protease pro-enzyme activation domain-containing protein [Streptosporangiales bacterium]|nr:protease pro-enzyme activation domain-containing protein [Streptosporangiales bacterium]
MRVSYRTLIVAAALAGPAFAAPAAASAAAGGPAGPGAAAYSALPGSTGPAPGKVTGRYDSDSMTIEVSLVPRDAAATAKAVETYLRGQGLAAGPGSSPTLVRATGPSSRVGKAFHTTLSTYTSPSGARYYANSTPVYVPASLASRIIGVIGLSNTQRARPLAGRR